MKFVHHIHGPVSKPTIGAKRALKDMEDEIIRDEVSLCVAEIVRQVAAKTRRTVSADKRKKYTAVFKAEVIHAAGDVPLRTVALEYGIDCSMVQRWVKNKDNILKKATASSPPQNPTGKET